MPNGQAPLWITIALAALTLIGTLGGALGGQIVAARAALKREEAERNHDKQAYWREQRFDLYRKMMLTTKELLRIVDPRINTSSPTEVEKQAFPLLKDLLQSLVDVELIASKTVLECSQDTYRAFFELLSMVKAESDEERQNYGKLLLGLELLVYKQKYMCRLDLGISETSEELI